MKKANTNTIPQCTAEYRAELEKVWGKGADMVDYCVKHCHHYMLPCGRIYEIDVPRIETRFCFGWSAFGEDDYNDACRMEHRARTTRDYFIEHNMEHAEFSNALKLLADDRSRPMLRPRYYGPRNNVVALVNERGYLVVTEKAEFIELSPEDREFILAVLEQEKAMFEKRLQAYLKRYGLSKLHTWTYWQDA